MFNDCTTRAEFHSAAESLVPHDGGGSEQFWVLAARTLFVETCMKLSEAGRGTNAALAQELMNADLSDLHRLLEDTMAGPISTPSAARMAESVRAVFNVNGKAMQMLPDEGPQFSVRDWVNGAAEPGSLLFLSSRYVDMSVLSQLLTLWLDTAIHTLMTGRRTPDLKLWFLIDELGALHRLPSLEKGLQTARNFGGAIVTGVHTFAKLKEVYGDNMAMTLSSLARTKLILATADRETATWCSDIIGHREVREMEEGYSYGYNNARDAVSLTPRRQVVPLLLPDEFMGLPSLEGYLKFPDGLPAAPVTLRPRDWPRVAEGFIPRPVVTPAGPGVGEGGTSGQVSAAPAAGQDAPNASGSSDDDGSEGRKAAPDAASRGKRKRQAKDPASQGKRSKGAARQHPASGPAPDPNAAQLPDGTRTPATRPPAVNGHQPQGELPLPTEPRDPSRDGRIGADPERSDSPDPLKAQRDHASRAAEDQRLQEEQQRGLLGGAARKDPGEIEPDL